MATRFADHLLTGTHAARPAATAVPSGTLYACTDHTKVYQSDGATWADWHDGSAGGGGGVLLQQVRARITTSPTDTTGSFVSSGLEVAITPTSSTSIIVVEADGEIHADRVGTSGPERNSRVRIQNTTSATTITEAFRGRHLTASSSVAATSRNPIALKGWETSGSTTARTYRLEFCSGTATEVQATLIGSRAGGVTLIASEISA